MRSTSQISKDRPVHFIAIGGIGMSGIALTLLHRGYEVTGSDLTISSITSRLQDAGAIVYHGHRASHVPPGATVVHSSAVGVDNPEILQARAWGLPVLRRAEVLAWLMEDRDSVAVAGTHGKTTTTSLVTLMLRHAGYDPSAVVGGVVDALDGNTLCGDGPHFVAEADESDGSLVLFHPRTSIITNIEEEHFGYYRDLQGILDIFGTFIENTLRDGKLIYNLDDLNLPRLVQDFDGEMLSYSLFQPADIFADNVVLESFGSSFAVQYRGRNLGRMELAIPGLHNVSNSLGALAVALQEGVPFQTAAEAVRSYRGVRRRFEVKGRVDDILVVDDYAHHPTEVKATLLSARHIANGGRLVGVFQPHRYTRTKHLHGRFSDAFASVDRLILTDIYSANEPAIEGVDGTVILRGVLESGQENVEYFPDWRDIAEALSETVHAGDVVVVMGAGNISTVADELVRKLRERKEQLLVVASDGR
jgi:UDP-N-acetylmuramate--alanine ligase